MGEVVLCSEDGSMEDRREEVGGGGRERGVGGSKALTPPVWDTGERERVTAGGRELLKTDQQWLEVVVHW